jgi:uncharacterized protein YndB with AHSA1/START domain
VTNKMTIQQTAETRGHTHELNIDVPIEAVWKAITEPSELANWFPLGAESELGPGGSITYSWGSEMICSCQIEAWEPGRHLRTSWMEAGENRPSLAVDWHLETDGGGTVLRLVHSGFGQTADFDDEFEGTRHGWTFELRSLQQYLNHHRGQTRRAFWLRRAVNLEPSAVWERFTGANGLILSGDLDARSDEPFRLALASGDAVEGTVIDNAPPRVFAGTADNHNRGLFRFGFESCSTDQPKAHLWLSTWGLPADEVDALERRWSEAMDRTFGASASM